MQEFEKYPKSVCQFCNGSGKLGTLDECRDCDKCNGTGQTDL